MKLNGRPGRDLVFFAPLKCSILGPIQLDGSPIGSPLERRLLAALLVARGSAVSVDRLLDVLWASDPPPSAQNTLQSKISRLRRLLGAEALRRVGSSYTLQLSAGACDADRFEDLINAADGLPPLQRIDVLDSALAEWSGRALDEFADEEFARPAAVGLEQRRLAACEQRLDCLLELNRCEEVLAAVEPLFEQDPFRESFWSAKMRALAASGRSIEALRCYHEARTRFVEETGVAPSSALAAVEQSILADSLENDLPVEQASAASVAQANGGISAAVDASTPAISELPFRPLDSTLVRPPLIARSRERGAIEAALVSALQGAPRLVNVVGEMGLGKTRLLEVAASSVRADGVRVLSGQCLPGAEVPLGPIGQIISALDVARFSSPTGESDFYNPLAAPGTLAIANVVLRLLDRLLEQPTVVVLDDLHWSDEATTSAIELLVTEMASRAATEPVPLAILAGRRPLSAELAAHAALARLDRHPSAETIELPKFDEGGVASMVEGSVGVRPSGATVSRLLEATDGTPLMVHTLLEHWFRNGELLIRAGCLDVAPGAEVVAPVDSDLMWEDRWGDADPETVGVLQVLSLCPLLDLLPKAAAVDVLAGVFEIDSAAVFDLLDRALGLGLLAGTSRIKFPPQARAFVQAKVANARRADLLERLGAQLSNVPRFDGDATVAERFPSLAADVAIAARESGAAAAVEDIGYWSRRAAEQSLNLGAWPAAVRYLETVATDMPRAEAVPTLSDGSPVDLALGLAAFRAHDEYRAQEVLRVAADRAEASNDPQNGGAALSVICRISFAFEGASDLPVSADQATGLMEAYIEQHASDCPRQAALGAAILAEQAAVHDQLDRADSLVSQARSICQKLDDATGSVTLPEVEFGGGLVALSALRLTEADRQFKASSQVAFKAGDRWVASWGAGRQILTSIMAGDDSGAQSAISRALDLQVPLRLWSELAMTRALQAALAASAGELGSAERLLEESASLAVRSGYSSASLFSAPVACFLAAQAGEMDRARSALEPLTNSQGRLPWSYLALLELVAGEPQVARELVLPRLARLPTVPTMARLPMVVAAAATGAATRDLSILDATAPAIEWLHQRGVRRIPGWPVPISELLQEPE